MTSPRPSAKGSAVWLLEPETLSWETVHRNAPAHRLRHTESGLPSSKRTGCETSTGTQSPRGRLANIALKTCSTCKVLNRLSWAQPGSLGFLARQTLPTTFDTLLEFLTTALGCEVQSAPESVFVPKEPTTPWALPQLLRQPLPPQRLAQPQHWARLALWVRRLHGFPAVP